MTYVLGIDGGGSTIRVVVASPDLTIHAQSQGTTANPALVGRAVAMQTIQNAVREAVAAAGLTAEQISAVGIGVAGAEARHSEGWLREVVAGVTPAAQVAPSGDHEIALVGAHGERRGMLLLAGTGSLACGVGSSGEYILVGATGYLIGDEGGGYWIGIEGLRAVMRSQDGRGRKTDLFPVLLNQLGLEKASEVVPWMYNSGESRTKVIAGLAGTVLAQAAQGDAVAQDIIQRAADELALAIRTLHFRLHMESLPIAFYGGLLTSPTRLSQLLCERLNLQAVPLPKYPAALGAAIMALALLKGRV